HNNEHAEKYMELANKASVAGNEELSNIFVKLYLESRRLNRLFEAAKKQTVKEGVRKRQNQKRQNDN
ncbi:MAG TPA: hypothetical protein DCY25_04120, partial [Bacteroidales bacterium]|nr:hypothetical protein [Bacteroidales bacterium]